MSTPPRTPEADRDPKQGAMVLRDPHTAVVSYQQPFDPWQHFINEIPVKAPNPEEWAPKTPFDERMVALKNESDEFIRGLARNPDMLAEALKLHRCPLPPPNAPDLHEGIRFRQVLYTAASKYMAACCDTHLVDPPPGTKYPRRLNCSASVLRPPVEIMSPGKAPRQVARYRDRATAYVEAANNFFQTVHDFLENLSHYGQTTRISAGKAPTKKALTHGTDLPTADNAAVLSDKLVGMGDFYHALSNVLLAVSLLSSDLSYNPNSGVPQVPPQLKTLKWGRKNPPSRGGIFRVLVLGACWHSAAMLAPFPLQFETISMHNLLELLTRHGHQVPYNGNDDDERGAMAVDHFVWREIIGGLANLQGEYTVNKLQKFGAAKLKLFQSFSDKFLPETDLTVPRKQLEPFDWERPAPIVEEPSSDDDPEYIGSITNLKRKGVPLETMQEVADKRARLAAAAAESGEGSSRPSVSITVNLGAAVPAGDQPGDQPPAGPSPVMDSQHRLVSEHGEGQPSSGADAEMEDPTGEKPGAGEAAQASSPSGRDMDVDQPSGDAQQDEPAGTTPGPNDAGGEGAGTADTNEEEPAPPQGDPASAENPPPNQDEAPSGRDMDVDQPSGDAQQDEPAGTTPGPNDAGGEGAGTADTNEEEPAPPQGDPASAENPPPEQDKDKNKDKRNKPPKDPDDKSKPLNAANFLAPVHIRLPDRALSKKVQKAIDDNADPKGILPDALARFMGNLSSVLLPKNPAFAYDALLPQTVAIKELADLINDTAVEQFSTTPDVVKIELTDIHGLKGEIELPRRSGDANARMLSAAKGLARITRLLPAAEKRRSLPKGVKGAIVDIDTGEDPILSKRKLLRLLSDNDGIVFRGSDFPRPNVDAVSWGARNPDAFKFPELQCDLPPGAQEHAVEHPTKRGAHSLPLRAGDMPELLKLTRENYPVLCLSDMPVASSAVANGDDGQTGIPHFETFASSHTSWDSVFPLAQLPHPLEPPLHSDTTESWRTQGAWVRPRVPAAGACTAIHCEEGSELWIVFGEDFQALKACDAIENLPEEEDDPLAGGVILYPGDTLFLAPRFLASLTVKHATCRVNYFYSFSTLKYTLRYRLQEACHGDDYSNGNSPHRHIWLFAMMMELHRNLYESKDARNLEWEGWRRPREDLPDSDSEDSDKEAGSDDEGDTNPVLNLGCDLEDIWCLLYMIMNQSFLWYQPETPQDTLARKDLLRSSAYLNMWKLAACAAREVMGALWNKETTWRRWGVRHCNSYFIAPFEVSLRHPSMAPGTTSASVMATPASRAAKRKAQAKLKQSRSKGKKRGHEEDGDADEESGGSEAEDEDGGGEAGEEESEEEGAEEEQREEEEEPEEEDSPSEEEEVRPKVIRRRPKGQPPTRRSQRVAKAAARAEDPEDSASSLGLE